MSIAEGRIIIENVEDIDRAGMKNSVEDGLTKGYFKDDRELEVFLEEQGNGCLFEVRQGVFDILRKERKD